MAKRLIAKHLRYAVEGAMVAGLFVLFRIMPLPLASDPLLSDDAASTLVLLLGSCAHSHAPATSCLPLTGVSAPQVGA